MFAAVQFIQQESWSFEGQELTFYGGHPSKGYPKFIKN